jgi:hypothetical protein
MEEMRPTLAETSQTLFYGIMRDALVCLLSKSKQKRSEARAWLLDAKAYSVFSSTTVMAACGVDAVAVRERVLSRRKIIIIRDGRGAGRSLMGRRQRRRVKRKAALVHKARHNQVKRPRVAPTRGMKKRVARG